MRRRDGVNIYDQMRWVNMNYSAKFGAVQIMNWKILTLDASLKSAFFRHLILGFI